MLFLKVVFWSCLFAALTCAMIYVGYRALLWFLTRSYR